MGYWELIQEFDMNFEVNSLVETMKMVLDIDHTNAEMTDEEIKGED